MTVSKLKRRARQAVGQGKRATIRDVARHAGVGPITVSRVLREPGKVSSILKQRVFTAIDALGYVSNHVASGLASGASRIVPVVIPTLSHSVYVPFLDGVRSELDRHGYEILLVTTEYRPDTEERLISTLLGWFPAGFLIAGVDHSDTARRHLLQAVDQGIPVIEYMDLAVDPIDINIGFSNREAGAAIAQYLAGRGYRHIGYIGTLSLLDQRSARRLGGFTDTLGALNLPHHYVLRGNESFSIGLGGRLLAQLLDHYPMVEAIFFANDDLAVGAMAEARRRGIELPGRLGIMGFNDLELATTVEPALTSVNVGQTHMGRLAALNLIDALAGRPLLERVIDTGFSIVERASTPRRP